MQHAIELLTLNIEKMENYLWSCDLEIEKLEERRGTAGFRGSYVDNIVHDIHYNMAIAEDKLRDYRKAIQRLSPDFQMIGTAHQVDHPNGWEIGDVSNSSDCLGEILCEKFAGEEVEVTIRRLSSEGRRGELDG